MMMHNIFLINETLTNGYLTDSLNLLSWFAVLCGVFVIINKNPIVSILFLIGLFASISSYLIMIGLGFIGLSYLIVYVGAVSILFLFILMLINIRISELQSNTSNTIPLAISITILLNYCLFQSIPYGITNLIHSNIILIKFLKGATTKEYFLNYLNNFNNLNNQNLSFVTSKMWDGNLAESSHMTSIGNVMYTIYNMWLLMASLILLLALCGVIVIVHNPRGSGAQGTGGIRGS